MKKKDYTGEIDGSMPKEIFVEEGEYSSEDNRRELSQSFDGMAKIILKTNMVLLLKDVKF